MITKDLILPEMRAPCEISFAENQRKSQTHIVSKNKSKTFFLNVLNLLTFGINYTPLLL